MCMCSMYICVYIHICVYIYVLFYIINLEPKRLQINNQYYKIYHYFNIKI